MTQESWTSIPWIPFPLQSTPSTPILSWHKEQVPYKPQPNDLQTLEIWIPNTTPESTQPASSSETPSRKGIWILYIHGGAWRDPLVTSTSFHSTVSHLLKSSAQLSNIAGLASLNYTLSPHPLHPTHATPSPESGNPIPASRSAHHPEHIHDVLSAISYLQSKFLFQNNYILSGHSCGATLSFQSVMNSSRFFLTSSSLSAPKIHKPNTILGLNGLYSLPSLLESPGEKHAHLIPLYRTFTISAFSPDPRVWNDVSPTSISDWKVEWPEGKIVVLVQSREDSLVGWAQTQEMLDVLNQQRQEKDLRLKVEEMSATGDHNDLWKEGERLAEIITGVCKRVYD